MGLGYVVTKRVFGFDKDKNEKYVAKSVRSGKVSFAKMCRKVSELCGVHRKVVDLVVSGLVPSLLLSVLRVRMTRRRSYPSRSFRERSYSIREKSSKIRWKI
mgnify:CR=1 FL=1